MMLCPNPVIFLLYLRATLGSPIPRPSSFKNLPNLTPASPAPQLNYGTYPDPEPCAGNCSWIHDPSIYFEGGTYWRFSTSGNIPISVSTDLKGPWEYKGALLDNGTSIFVVEGQDIWAPQIAKVENTYYAYYSVSAMGRQDSQIGVASSSSLDSGSWTDHGSFNLPKSRLYNLIDPFIFPDGDPASKDTPIYFTFGSYWDGIFQTDLPSVGGDGLIGYMGDPSDMTNLIRNTSSSAAVVEGATIFKNENYYYVFYSIGACCNVPPNLAKPGDEYRIAVCRATNVKGPYRDQNGVDCLNDDGATIILASHGDIYAPGGQGVMFDEKSKRHVLYYHYVRPSVGYGAEQFFFGFNYLDFSSEWPVVVS